MRLFGGGKREEGLALRDRMWDVGWGGGICLDGSLMIGLFLCLVGVWLV